MKGLLGFGVGLLHRGVSRKTLEVYFPLVFYQSHSELAEALSGGKPGEKNGTTKLSGEQLEKGIEACSAKKIANGKEIAATLSQLKSAGERVVLTVLASDSAPATIEEAYLKLHMLSRRFVRPHQLNLENLFDILPNVAWTSDGPIEIEELPERQLAARISGKSLEVYSVDKFPKLLNHVVPSHVRVADGSRVRLGAYIGEGTTIMQEGFVNFNAGTEGPNMVEGRISAGVFVSRGTDLGGGSSVMGLIRGDVNEVVSLGKDCLIGANAGAGISLGDGCTIEAGLYVTAGSKVELLDKSGKRTGVVKARDLSGRPNLLFRRNSTSGHVEARESEPTVKLNEKLHTN